MVTDGLSLWMVNSMWSVVRLVTVTSGQGVNDASGIEQATRDNRRKNRIDFMMVIGC